MFVANPSLENSPAGAALDDFAVVILARAPVAGRCKTRLAHGMGDQRAARLYDAMLERAVAHAAWRAPGRVLLACAPHTRHPAFVRLARRYAVMRCRQTRGDLGARMAHGIRLGLQRARSVVLMGSDQPALAHDEWLEGAIASLQQPGVGAWLAPTHDGGYWAIGLNVYAPRLFRGPRWSTPRVVCATRTGMLRLGFTRREAACRNDIDTPRDWQHLERGLKQRLARSAVMPGTRIAP